MTTVHRPDDVRIVRKECASLAAAGYCVTVLAPCGVDHICTGVRVVALPQPRSRFDRMTRIAVYALKKALDQKARIYHFHDPELIPAGIVLKLLGKRVVYDVHENLPAQIMGKYWVPARLRRILSVLVGLVEQAAARVLDAVVCATPAIAERFPSSRSTIVQNYPMPGELTRPHSLPYTKRPPSIAYIGGISVHRGALTMVKAMSMLPRDLGARLMLAGSYLPASLLTDLSNTEGWERIDNLGWLSRDELAGVLGQARAGLVLFHPMPNHVESQPNKLFEYMSCGIPVIASDFPLWRRIVDDAACGLLVNPQDPTAVAEAIKWVLENPCDAGVMGDRGRRSVQDKYSWAVEEATLLTLYSQLSE